MEPKMNGNATDDSPTAAPTPMQQDPNVALTSPPSPVPTSPSQRATYYDLRNEIWEQVKAPTAQGKPQPHSKSAYNRASVIQQAPWFPKQKMCKETCCVETVAVSLDQDQHKIINTGDGRDLADLKMDYYFHRGGDHLKYHSGSLQEDMLPCLVPGTIIFIENCEKGIKYFWNTLRPKIHVPYTLIVSGSDADTPGTISERFMGDPLLTKFYGTNPRHPQLAIATKNMHKYQSMGLGLGRVHPQERHILPYLELTNFSNPFLDKQRWNFSQQPFDFDEDVFVHFGLKSKESRRKLWKILCPSNTNGTSSCNSNTKNHPSHDIYMDMSHYRFGISPPGMGFDNYRTYELLLLGVIPVIEERALGGRKLFEGLPVVHMPSMGKATTKQDFVDAIQKYINSGAFQNGSFGEGWEKLFLQYRRRQILKDTLREKEILFDEQGKEYYQAYRYSVRGPKANNEETFCHSEGSCEIPRNRIDAKWLQNPTPPLSKEDSSWLAAWQRGH